MQIKMYTKAYCSFCYAAKNLLTKRGLDFEEISLSGDAATEQEMRELTGRTTVPQILIDGTAIGGYTELVEMMNPGRLPQWLEWVSGPARWFKMGTTGLRPAFALIRNYVR